MRLSSENSLKNIIYNNFGNERGSIYVHHTSQPNSISELESYFPFKKMKIFRRSELFTREYFSSQISLGNNVKFISEINNLDISEFLESHYLFDIFTKYKNFTRKDIPIDLYNKLMFFLYLNTNSIYLISFNLSSLLGSMDEKMHNKIQDYFSDNQMFYFSYFFQRNLIKDGLFRYFLVLYGKNEHKIFDNAQDFKNFIAN